MTTYGKIYVGDHPTFRDVIKDQDGTIVDIGSATTIDMIFRKPDGSAMVKAASLTTDGSDGKMEWTPTNELDQAQNWQRHSKVIIGGRTFRSVKVNFKVWEPLPES